MSAKNLRTNVVIEASNRPTRNISWPQKNGRPAYVSELFGENVFSLQKLQSALPKPVYNIFIQQLRGRKTLDKATADAVAHAVRVWAMDRGATHYCHWFQPQTGTTASKHDTFLSLRTVLNNGVEETSAIDTFSGSALLQSEPDASSFPNGGMRTTFEARGYTVWDTSSPMFLRKGPHGTFVLYIPSVFISYNGDALDEKTILLRSQEALSEAAVGLLKVLGDADTRRVTTTLGCEQEFFLVDRSLYQMRTDLKMTGRTLIGQQPPKHQQLEDHYFGAIPSRVLNTLSELEMELFLLGVPLKTRHNEVAPKQFEVAPIFEEASVAVDHNLLTMETLHTVAHRNGLKVLFHEKPFKGINGSGKHGNWSMQTDSGENLLDPTLKPETNYRFLLFLLATLDAVHKHGGLLRCGIASASNEHRLGGQEAPPGIISVFLGDHLNEVLNSLEESRDVKNFSQPTLSTVKVGGTVLDLKITTLPPIARDLTDRNRTSPFAFTGNKFEFRAIGAKQSPSFPITLLNAAVAASLQEITEAILKQKGTRTELKIDDILPVIRTFIKRTKPVRFEGNNYSQEWAIEAEKRGLPNLKTAPDAFKQLLEAKSVEVLTKGGILSEAEIHSRFHIMSEFYAKNQLIEANALKGLIVGGVIPAALEQRQDLLNSLMNLKNLGLNEKISVEYKHLASIGVVVEKLRAQVDELQVEIAKVEKEEAAEKQATLASKVLTVAMDKVRELSDELEELVADKYWPIPKYSELLF